MQRCFVPVTPVVVQMPAAAAAGAAGLDVPRYDGGFFVVVFTPDGEKTAAVMRDMGVYVIPLKGAVRVALCATPESEIPRLIAALRAGIDQAKAEQGDSPSGPLHYQY